MHTSKSNRAFTLIELLVVLFLIALIIGILLVALGAVRRSTRRVESANALRQMVAAYDMYSSDHNKQLMPGFVTAAQATSFNIIPEREDGSDHVAEDSQGYVWRLAPYLAHNWKTMFVDYGSKRLLSSLDAEVSRGVYGRATTTLASQYGIAEIPSFGLNSIFLGGDEQHGNDVATNYSPWNTLGNDTIAATRYSEVKSPAQMIVFAPVKQANDALNPNQAETLIDWEYGYVELRPPFVTLAAGDIWTDQQWELEGDGSAAKPLVDISRGCGLPIARWGGDSFPVGNLDGSTTNETLTSVSNDMKRWSPKAKGHFAD